MKFQYYWDHGIWPPDGHGSNGTEGEDMGSAVDRIKSKALQAKGVVPRALASVEADLDEIIAAEAEIEALRLRLWLLTRRLLPIPKLNWQGLSRLWTSCPMVDPLCRYLLP